MDGKPLAHIAGEKKNLHSCVNRPGGKILKAKALGLDLFYFKMIMNLTN